LNYLIIFIISFIVLLAEHVSAQENAIYQVSGIVVDDSSKAIPFTHILIKGKRSGTICDFEGYFSLVAKPNDTLVFSSIGYKKGYFSINNNIEKAEIYITKILHSDTIMLAETTVFPWNSYEQFKEAFLKLDIPDDDINRALKNLALIEEQLKLYSNEPDPSLNYKYFMQQTYNQLYYAGQLPPNNLLNPIAWSQFFKALKNGDFKRKKYKIEYYD
jgi:hypothetical protein